MTDSSSSSTNVADLYSMAEEMPGSKNISVLIDCGEGEDSKASFLYLFADLTKNFGESSSGKTFMVASTSGNKPLGKSNGTLGLNMYCKDPKAVKLDGLKDKFGAEWAEEGRNMAWRMVTTKVICLRVDMSSAESADTVSASGKTVSLATSSGNKKIGASTIMYGLNFYRAVDKKFALDKLQEKGPVDAVYCSSASATEGATSTVTLSIDASKLKKGDQVNERYTPIAKSPGFQFQAMLSLAEVLSDEEGLGSTPDPAKLLDADMMDSVTVEVKNKTKLVFVVDVSDDEKRKLSTSGKSYTHLSLRNKQVGPLKLTLYLIQKVLPPSEDKVREATLAHLGSIPSEELRKVKEHSVREAVCNALNIKIDNIHDVTKTQIRESIISFMKAKKEATKSEGGEAGSPKREREEDGGVKKEEADGEPVKQVPKTEAKEE